MSVTLPPDHLSSTEAGAAVGDVEGTKVGPSAAYTNMECIVADKKDARSKAIKHLQKMFCDEGIWEQPPPSPPEPKSESNNRRGQLCERFGARKTKPCKPNVTKALEMSSDSDPDAELNIKKITNKPADPADLSVKELDAVAFEHLSLKQGEASEKLQFVPWNLLIRYAEMYVGKGNKDKVVPYFEEDFLFQNQPWDFFYLYDPDCLTDDPIIFVPTRQLIALLDKINMEQKIKLRIPDGGNERKFLVQFGAFGSPRPRYLGRGSSVASYEKLLHNMPLPDPEDDLTNIDQLGRDEFKETTKKVKESWMRGGKEKKYKNAQKRYDNRKAWGQTTKRVQRYLGLREKASSNINYQDFTGQEARPKADALDINASAPFENEGQVIFICVDVETYEKNTKLVTELGFAILDTKDLVGVPPGDGAENWFQRIRARHIRIKEYSYMRNTEYVEGCPDSFKFGSSEFVPLDKVLKVMDEIMLPVSSSGAPRKVVLVGHDVNQDIDHIGTLDFDAYKMENLLEIVDNQPLQQHKCRFDQPQSLGAVLTGLNIPYMYLHNAGNDAVYTLQSLLRLAVVKRQDSLHKAQKTTGSVSQALNPANDTAGWSSGGEDTDGGEPPRRKDPNTWDEGEVFITDKQCPAGPDGSGGW